MLSYFLLDRFICLVTKHLVCCFQVVIAFVMISVVGCHMNDVISLLNRLSSNITSGEQYNKRSGSLELDKPCDCETQIEWTDLGESIYPRHLRETKCVSSHCWYGHSTCNPVFYTVRVLTRNFTPYEDPLLPEELRSEWTFSERTVSVGCLCRR